MKSDKTHFARDNFILRVGNNNTKLFRRNILRVSGNVQNQQNTNNNAENCSSC